MVQKQVLRLQVSVRNLLRVAMGEPFHELFEIVTSKWLLESAGSSDKVKQLSTKSKLQHNIGDSLSFAIVLDVFGSPLIKLCYDVGMLEFRHGFHLGFKEFKDFFVSVVAHDLDGDLSPGVVICAQFYLAARLNQGFL